MGHVRERPRHPPGPRLGDALARRDVERLRRIADLQRRLRSDGERARPRSLAHHGIFREALTWMEIHGDAPDVVEHWGSSTRAPRTGIGGQRRRSGSAP